MKIITFDDGFVLDDPNSFWGDPAYQLEPGDPGYVDPSPSVNQPKKHKHMKTNPFWPRQQPAQIIWLVNMINKLPGHATATARFTARAMRR
jgi:hypothetical protein